MTVRHNQQQPLVWMIVLQVSIIFTLLFISDYLMPWFDLCLLNVLLYPYNMQRLFSDNMKMHIF